MNKANTSPFYYFLTKIVPITLSLLIANTSKLYTQTKTSSQISFTNFANIDGFPKQEIFDITTDKQGFFWVASTDGLYKFDASHSVQIYKKGNPAIDGGLQSSSIRAVYADSKNNIWIGTTLGGLTKFDQASGTWQTYLSDTNDKFSISNNDILSILEDSQGRIWVGTENGLNLYNQATDNFYSFVSDSSDSTTISAKAVVSILEDNAGRIWASTWAGGFNLLLTDKQGHIADSQFRRFYPSKNKVTHNVWKLYQDRNNRFWAGTTGGGLFLVDIPSAASDNIKEQDWDLQFYNFIHTENDETSIASSVIFDMKEDNQGCFWIATNAGLSRTRIPSNFTAKDYPNLKLKFEHSYANPTKIHSIGSGNIYTIYKDKQELLWFGTSSGLSHYSWYANQFQNYSIFGTSKQAAKIKDIYAISEEVIWVSTDKKGLLEYNTKNNKLRPITTKGDNQLLNTSLYSLYSKDGKKIYVGTEQGIAIIDLVSLKTRSLPLPQWLKNLSSRFYVTCIFKDNKEELWVGTDMGLFKINEKTGQYISFKHDINNPTSISDNTISGIFEDDRGYLWVATYNGLNRTNLNQPGKTFFKRYQHSANPQENSIPFNYLIGLEQIDNYLYIGSRRGLFSYNLDTERFEELNQKTTKSGILSLLKGVDNNLWGSSRHGLFSYNTKNKSFRIFNSHDELGGFIYSPRAKAKRSQHLFFASSNGITKFNPFTIKRNKEIPSIAITDIKKLNPDGAFIINHFKQQNIELNHDDYHLSINFALQNYISSHQNKYAYKLEGFNKNWTYTNETRAAVYTNLAHGTYTFKVKGANNDGIWNEIPTTLTIIKKPAFWETWWFKGLLKRNQELKIYTDNLNQEITERKRIETELQKREQYMEVLVKQRTKQLEVKNVEVNALLEKLKNRNNELEEKVAERTQELKDYNEELKRSNYDLEQFAYIASHDLQSPLRTIKSFSSLLVKSLEGKLNDREKDFIGFITQSVGNMEELVDSLLTFSRVNAKRGTIKPIDLSKLCQVIQSELATTIEEQNAVIQLSNLPDIVYADKIKFKQLLQNLITNGIKFSKKGRSPIVKIQCEEQVDSWRFEVKDNGIGIDEQFKEKIFLIFQRLHTKEEYQGTGIGLALCKKIVEQHGGNIWVESEEGEGSRFIFTINKALN